MTRIHVPTRDQAPASTHATLDAIGKQLGFIPNMFRMVATSPDTFAGIIGFQGAMSKALNMKTRDAIALAVTDSNDCHYCMRAHTYVATNLVKSSAEEIAMNRVGQSEDPKRAAAATFAKALVERRGKVTAEEMHAVRAAGYSDAEIIDITAVAVQFLLTNFINNMADTEVDFPSVTNA